MLTYQRIEEIAQVIESISTYEDVLDFEVERAHQAAKDLRDLNEELNPTFGK